MLKYYVIIDMMEQEYYYYYDEITMGFSLDKILEERDRLEIPYKVERFNNGNVLVIKWR